MRFHSMNAILYAADDAGWSFVAHLGTDVHEVRLVKDGIRASAFFDPDGRMFEAWGVNGTVDIHGARSFIRYLKTGDAA